MQSPKPVATLVFSLLFAACGRGTSDSAASPPASAPSTLPSSVQNQSQPRIVSTVPAATLNLVLIGGTASLVGVSKYDRLYLPPDKQDLPVVGDYQQINYEQLVKLKPTALVMQQEESRIESRLKQFIAAQHIELVNMHFENINDIWSSVRLLGKVSDREAAAERAIKTAQQELQDIAAKYQHAPHPKVLYLVTASPLTVAGGNTFIDEMITAAGAVNVGAVAGKGYIDVSRETIVKLAPDVLVICALEQSDPVVNDPRMSAWVDMPIPAAKNKRLYLVTDGNSLMASVDIGKNVRTLAELIHRGEPERPPPTSPAGEKP